MNFDLNDEQAQFRATIERFVGPGDVEHRKRVRREPGGVDTGRWAELAELGILALPAAEDKGGLGGTPIDCVIVAEAIGRGMAPDPWRECGDWPLRRRNGLVGGGALSERLASGAAHVAVAFAETGHRYKMVPCDMAAVRSADGWILSGKKSVVFGGEGVDCYLVTAQAEGQPALFAVDARAVDARAFTVVDGGRAVALALRGVAVGEEAMLGFADAAIEDAVAETRLIAAAEMSGLARRLFDHTLDYVRQREQFGQPIGSFQAVQHRLVDCYAMLEQMQSTIWRAALIERDPAGRWRGELAGAKAFVAERALHIGHEAIQLHGGMGMSDELSIGHAHKRVLLLSHLFGDIATDLATYARVA